MQFVEARYLILDETDLYPPGAVKMAVDRSTTYWNRTIVDLSRPTVPEGHINTEYLRSDQRKFWVPCPHCGGYQVLSFDQVKCKGAALGEWPPEQRDPEYIKAERIARYECRYCQGEIDDKDKPGMLARGKWVPEGHPIERDGSMEPPPPVSHVGFWWSALYSPFKNFSEIAAEFFTVKNEPDDLRNFINQWLAQPWKDVVEVKEESAILQLRTTRPPRVVPDGTLGLTAGIDNQKHGFWVSIWAWVLTPSNVLDQHLVRYGWVRDEPELEAWLFTDLYWDDSARVSYPVWRSAIDIGGGPGDEGVGSLTEQAYEWLRRAGQGRVFGIKGAGRALTGGRKMIMNVIDRMPGKGLPIPGGIRLWTVDTGMLKDAFWTRVGMGRVHLHAETGNDFANHLASEFKERDNKGREVWVQQGRRPNHLLDTVIYATAMADRDCWGGVTVLTRPGKSPVVEPQVSANSFAGQPRGSWLKR